MKLLPLKLIIVVMVVAFTILLFVTSYWAFNTYNYRKRQFEEKTQESLLSVRKRLNKHYLYQELPSEAWFGESIDTTGNDTIHVRSFTNLTSTGGITADDHIVTASAEGSPGMIKQEVRVKIIDDNPPPKEVIRLRDKIHGFYKEAQNFHFDEFNREIQTFDLESEDREEGTFMLELDGDNPEIEDFGFVKDLISEVLIATRRPTDSLLVDSLLNEEFSARNGFPGASFSIEDRKSEASRIEKETGLPVYVGELYSMNIFGRKNYIMVHFPGQQWFLLKQISLPLAASGLVLVIIIVCFFAVISAFNRQKRLSSMKTDFINNMTHELKTPISTISLAAEALRENSRMDGDQFSYFMSIIAQENERLKKHVERVLEVAKLETGEAKLVLKELDVHSLIAEEAERLQLSLEAKSGTMAMKLNAKKSVMLADEFHLGNAIYNLLDNALKYSNKEPEVEISTKNHNGQLVISIRDNGVGISKQSQKHIFERFYRVPTGNVHDVKGFGLGLSYVKEVTELHGGKVDLESEPGNGTTFSIYLPLKNK